MSEDKGNQQFQEFRKEVLGKISPSFCAAKWYNATIWLGTGHTTSCHHPPRHQIPLRGLDENPAQIHNSRRKKLEREMMLNGERPKGCEYCWILEDMNDENRVSDRVFKSNIYETADLLSLKDKDPHDDFNLKTLEVAFDRSCNFACSYCNPTFSTTWSQDIKRNGPYQGFIHTDGLAFADNGDKQFKYPEREDNPYIQAFWDWWPTLSQSLQELRITGGEPLLSQDVWKVLDYFNEHPETEVALAINSNLGVKPALIDRFIEKSQNVKNLSLYTSCEAAFEQAEYIRDGLDYDYFVTNVEKILEQGNVQTLNIMFTINGLCLFSITDFLDQCMQWKRKYGVNKPALSINLLRFPSFMSALALPFELRKSRKEAIEAWYQAHIEDPLFQIHERESLIRLMDYLMTVEQPHSNSSDASTAAFDFKNFYVQYDKRRGKSFTKTFPRDLVDWYESISKPPKANYFKKKFYTLRSMIKEKGAALRP